MGVHGRTAHHLRSGTGRGETHGPVCGTERSPVPRQAHDAGAEELPVRLPPSPAPTVLLLHQAGGAVQQSPAAPPGRHAQNPRGPGKPPGGKTCLFFMMLADDTVRHFRVTYMYCTCTLG